MTLTIEVLHANLWDEVHKTFQNNGGVYKIVAIENNNAISINRFLGIDTNGILYIGKASCFTKRPIDLIKSLLPNYISKGHKFGNVYKQHLKISKSFNLEKLYIAFIQSDNPKELETQLLQEYFDSFGELPTFNAIM